MAMLDSTDWTEKLPYLCKLTKNNRKQRQKSKKYEALPYLFPFSSAPTSKWSTFGFQ